MIVASYVVIHLYVGDMSVFWALIAGLVAGFLISVATEYYTSADHRPAQMIAYALGGLFGIALAAMGMLINLGMLRSMDCYGPIADNAAGIAEVAELGVEVRSCCEALDAVGNTTAALGKGFSVASAGLAASSPVECCPLSSARLPLRE